MSIMIRRTVLTLVALITAIFLSNFSAVAATYQIDASHSSMGFAVKYLVVGTTRGEFTDYFGTVTFDKDNLNKFSAKVTIQ